MNLLPPPLSLPRIIPPPPPPPPPLFTYKKKFADNMADSISITGRENVLPSTYSSNKNVKSSKDGSKMDESEIKSLFGEFWNSEYPRFGEGQLGERGEVEVLQNALEVSEDGNEEKKDKGKEREQRRNDKVDEREEDRLIAAVKDKEIGENEDEVQSHQYQSTAGPGFFSWKENNMPEEGWKVGPKVDKFRSIMLVNREKTCRDRLGSPLSSLTDNNEDLLKLYGGYNVGNNEECRGTRERAEEEILDERKNIISSMIKKYEMKGGKDELNESESESESESETRNLDQLRAELEQKGGKREKRKYMAVQAEENKKGEEKEESLSERDVQIALQVTATSSSSTEVDFENRHEKRRVEDKSEGKVKENSEGRVEERSEGRVKERSEGRVEENSEGKVKENSEGRLNENGEGRVEEGSEGRVEEGSEGRVEENSEGRVEERSEGRVEERSEGRVEERSEGRVEEGSEGRVGIISSGSLQISLDRNSTHSNECSSSSHDNRNNNDSDNVSSSMTSRGIISDASRGRQIDGELVITKSRETDEKRGRDKNDHDSEEEGEERKEEEVVEGEEDGEDGFTKETKAARTKNKKEKFNENESTMVYSRIHGYRINMDPGLDSTSIYKRALGGLTQTQVRFIYREIQVC